MTKLPEQINNAVQEFIKSVKDILGDRAKKLYYMVLMQEETTMTVQILTL